MSIGRKNRLVEFWTLSGAVDGANQPIPDDYVFVKRKWAEVKGETGLGSIRSAASAGGINTPLDRYSYRVNYDPSLNIGMQLRDADGTRLNILAVRHDKAARKWSDVVCEQGGKDG